MNDFALLLIARDNNRVCVLDNLPHRLPGGMRTERDVSVVATAMRVAQEKLALLLGETDLLLASVQAHRFREDRGPYGPKDGAYGAERRVHLFWVRRIYNEPAAQELGVKLSWLTYDELLVAAPSYMDYYRHLLRNNADALTDGAGNFHATVFDFKTPEEAP